MCEFLTPALAACRIRYRFGGWDIPEVLEFESWWNEEGPSKLDHPPGPGTTVRRLNAQTGHGTKHTMTIFYFTAEQLFQVHIGTPWDRPECCRAGAAYLPHRGFLACPLILL